ncbi:hypothetical protein ACJRO7_004751 [Eucalyptus globulus]|uniref:Uncharacterized protein n=1 Tax=Eucalyptus globulus TaxID=34317 RepID=A0ABD3J2T2_EUCGL
MRGRSYTLSPPRGYGRRGRSPSPRGRYVGRSRDMSASLLNYIIYACLAIGPQDLPKCGLEMASNGPKKRWKLLKKPTRRRSSETGQLRRGRSGRRRSPVGYSCSPPPRHARSRSRSRDYYSPPAKRKYSRSASPQEKRHGREKSYSPRSGRDTSRERSYSRSPPINGSRSDRESPAQGKSRSRSRSPPLEDYAREPNGDGTPSQ